MSQPNSRFCPICGSVLSSTDSVCPTCGSEVEEREPIITPQAPIQQNYTPWIFFGLGFFLGMFAVQEFLPSSDSWSLGVTLGSSNGFPILLVTLSLISVGIGVYFFIRNKKRISGTITKKNNANAN